MVDRVITVGARKRSEIVSSLTERQPVSTASVNLSSVSTKNALHYTNLEGKAVALGNLPEAMKPKRYVYQ